jgi:hypothetical protein
LTGIELGPGCLFICQRIGVIFRAGLCPGLIVGAALRLDVLVDARPSLGILVGT